jgi:molybdate transport system substrate-binding protein
MFRIFLLAGALIVAPLLSAAQAAEQYTIFAAASMKDALDKAAKDFEAANGTKIVLSFASSSVLAKQIEAAAPADAFISADLQWMDYLAERKLIKPDTRRIIARNDLVVAAAPGTKPASDPEALLSGGKFAMGDPKGVPAGKYGKAALESLKLWDKVEKNAVFSENVRVALEYVRKGAVGAAIVYGSDRFAAPELATAYTFPEDSHKPIVYPAAETVNGNDGVVKFLDFLSSEAGQKNFVAFGFAPAKK